MRVAGTLVLGAGLLTAVVADVTPVSRNGRYLVNSDGSRFVIKGIAYQPQGNIAAQTEENQAHGGFPEPDSYVDPLANPTACQRDVTNLQTLGVNAIRVYNVNGYQDHSGCMNAFNQANIHVIADLALPQNGSINRAAPSWDVSLLAEYTQTIDNLLPYSNLLAVNIANEVVTSANNTVTSAFVKAAARDVKSYLNSKSSNVLVGYSSADGAGWRTELANYLACGDESTQIDIFGLNSYSGCGASSISPYNNLNSDFETYPVVAYFSEFGCLDSGSRTWSEVEVILGTEMLSIWSGGLAFEYFFDSQGLGLTANLTDRDGPITTNADFTRLANEYNRVTLPTAVPSTTGQTPACPSNSNQLSSTNLPRTPNSQECTCLVNTAWSCLPKPDLAPAVVGDQLNQACTVLGSAGGSCDAIASDGATGKYGEFSGCAPIDKLAYVYSTYYDLTNRASTSCDFGGNATVNTNVQASNQASATAACADGQQATFTPSSVSTSTRTGGADSGDSSDNNSSGNSVTVPLGPLFGLVASLTAGALGFVAIL
jgi:1,3-beta-glucanosyltransferase GAS1